MTVGNERVVSYLYDGPSARDSSSVSPTASFKGSLRSRWAVSDVTTDTSPTKSQIPLLDRIGPSLSERLHTSLPSYAYTSTTDTNTWTTSRTQTADSGWGATSPTPPSVRSVQEHGHSRVSSQASSAQFCYEESAEIRTASIATDKKEDSASSESPDDGWSDWKPKVAPEQEGAAAFRQRCLKKTTIEMSYHQTANTSATTPSSAIHSTKTHPTTSFMRDLPPHLASFSATHDSPQSPLSSQDLVTSAEVVSAPTNQSESAPAEDDRWSAWKESVKPVSGDDAFRRRQALADSSLSQSPFTQTSTTPNVTAVVTQPTFLPTIPVQPVVELPLSSTNSTKSNKDKASPDEEQNAKEASSDPWSAWSATPQKNTGGAEAFRRRQAMGLGERMDTIPGTSSTSTKSTTFNGPVSIPMPNKAGTPVSSKKPVTPAKIPPKPTINANKTSQASSQTSTSTSRSNVRSPGGRGRSAYRSRGRGSGQAISPALGANAVPRKTVPTSQQATASPARPSAAPQSSKLANTPAATTSHTSNRVIANERQSNKPASSNASPSQAAETKKSDIPSAQAALLTVSNALEKVRDRIAGCQPMQETLKTDVAIQVPEESLIDLVSGTPPNIMDVVETEQMEMLTQLEGLTFEASSSASSRPRFAGVASRLNDTQTSILPFTQGNLLELDVNTTSSVKETSPVAALDGTPRPYRSLLNRAEANESHQRSTSACSVTTFHSATDNVPCLIDDEAGQSDGGSPVTPMQPLRVVQEYDVSKGSSIKSQESRMPADDERSTKLVNALTNLGYSGTILARLLGHMSKLPKKDKAMCLFNEAFLHRKVAEALMVIAAEDEESEEEL